jgi:DivIVA domain-containing protein
MARLSLAAFAVGTCGWWSRVRWTPRPLTRTGRSSSPYSPFRLAAQGNWVPLGADRNRQIFRLLFAVFLAPCAVLYSGRAQTGSASSARVAKSLCYGPRHVSEAAVSTSRQRPVPAVFAKYSAPAHSMAKMSQPSMRPTSGWYQDPAGSGRLRYFNGQNWTDQYSDAPQSVGSHARTPQTPLSSTVSSPADAKKATSLPHGSAVAVFGTFILILVVIFGVKAHLEGTEVVVWAWVVILVLIVVVCALLLAGFSSLVRRLSKRNQKESGPKSQHDFAVRLEPETQRRSAVTTRGGLTPDDVHNVAFSSPPVGKRGYDVAEVDAFLELVEAALRDPSRCTLTPEDVHNVAFSKPPIEKRGYNEDEVDGILDLVEEEMKHRVTGTGA